MRLEQMSEMWYPTGVNRIKSSEALERTRYPFSTDVRGIDTMSHSIPNQPAFKTCTKCEKSLPLSEFVLRKTGRQAGRYEARCKSCSLEMTRHWRELNRSHIAAYNQTQRTEKSSLFNESMRKSRERFPERKKAGDAVRNEVRRGRFPPVWTQVCEHCEEAQAAQYHHHNGYDLEHKLDVIALCAECHGKAHWVN